MMIGKRLRLLLLLVLRKCVVVGWLRGRWLTKPFGPLGKLLFLRSFLLLLVVSGLCSLLLATHSLSLLARLIVFLLDQV